MILQYSTWFLNITKKHTVYGLLLYVVCIYNIYIYIYTLYAILYIMLYYIVYYMYIIYVIWILYTVSHTHTRAHLRLYAQFRDIDMFGSFAWGPCAYLPVYV